MGIEEKDVEMIEVQSPVYVRKDSIQDVLAVRELDDAIDAKSKEKEAKEVEVQSVKDDREKLSEDIGIINTGQHINEVALKIQKLRELDETTRIKESELEEIYSSLRKLQDDRDALDETARNMVDKMTEDYNSIVEKQVKLVENYRQTANFEVYNEVLKLTDEANEFAKYESYDAILEGKEAQSEEEKSQEEKEETKDEEAKAPEVEASAEEKAQEEVAPELDNVKVDSLPEEETKEEKAVVTPIAETEAPVAETPEVETPVAEVTPLPTDQPVVSSGVEMKSFAQLVEETKDEEAKAPEVEAPVAETPAPAVVTPIAETPAPVVETPAAEVTPLASESPAEEAPVATNNINSDSIKYLIGEKPLAVSSVKGRNQTIEVFAKSNNLDKAKTLEKVA
jgi:hypothetical protein